MAKAKQNKYIDLNQFIIKDNGRISWKESVGIVAEFFYNEERHEIEILDYLIKDYVKVRIDDMILDKVNTSSIYKLNFDKLFYKPNYLYEVGDIVNNLYIISQCLVEINGKSTSGKVKTKAYKCKCLKDGYIFESQEYNLKSGHGCPVCSNHKIIKGVNDIATTDKDLVEFFNDINDAYTHSRASDYEVIVICPYCKTKKKMRIAELTKYGYVTCNKCSDGLSYPNKFAHELFSQLQGQYLEYIPEYSPKWAQKYRYDNYIKLLDGSELIVEMDGGLHYHQNKKFAAKNDKLKDTLAHQNGVTIVRINCNYSKTGQRFSFIRDNIILSLNKYFELSNVDWDKCNSIAISNRLINVLDYYKCNPKLGLPEIATYFKISMETLYNYLYIGETLGLCTYVRNDPNRIKNSKPVSMYDINGNLIGIFKSAKQIEQAFPEKEFKHRSIRKNISDNRIYKGYYFKFSTYNEYQAYQSA